MHVHVRFENLAEKMYTRAAHESTLIGSILTAIMSNIICIIVKHAHGGAFYVIYLSISAEQCVYLLLQ